MESLARKCIEKLSEAEALQLINYMFPSELIYANLQKQRIIDINNCCKYVNTDPVLINKLEIYCDQHIAISDGIKDVDRTLPPKIIVGSNRIYKHSLKYTNNNELLIAMTFERDTPIITFHNKKYEYYKCIVLGKSIIYSSTWLHFKVDMRVPSIHMSQPFVNESDWMKTKK